MGTSPAEDASACRGGHVQTEPLKSSRRFQPLVRQGSEARFQGKIPQNGRRRFWEESGTYEICGRGKPTVPHVLVGTSNAAQASPLTLAGKAAVAGERRRSISPRGSLVPGTALLPPVPAEPRDVLWGVGTPRS